MKEQPIGFWVSVFSFIMLLAFVWILWPTDAALWPLSIMLAALWWKAQTQRWMRGHNKRN